MGATPPALSSLPSSFQTPEGLEGELLLSPWPSPLGACLPSFSFHITEIKASPEAKDKFCGLPVLSVQSSSQGGYTCTLVAPGLNFLSPHPAPHHPEPRPTESLSFCILSTPASSFLLLYPSFSPFFRQSDKCGNSGPNLGLPRPDRRLPVSTRKAEAISHRGFGGQHNLHPIGETSGRT